MPLDPAGTARMYVPGIDDLLRRSRFPKDPRTIAFAGAIGQALAGGRRPLIRGLPEGAFQRLLRSCFHGVRLCNGRPEPSSEPVLDEFDELLALLLANRAQPSEIDAWLSHCIASASMQDRHLWEDLGLPDRKHLSRLMQDHFPALAASNTADMRWKKFFYRELCRASGLVLCKSPNCADCCDYKLCFATSEATVLSRAAITRQR